MLHSICDWLLGKTMKVGDLVKSNSGFRGIITEVEMMYPNHPESPVGRVAVEWIGKSPTWHHTRGQLFSAFSVEVISHANR